MLELTSSVHDQRQPASVPERELLGFVSAVTDLLGAGQTGFVADIWLDEVASMDILPESTSADWRLVTVAAWARLAQRMIDRCVVGNSF
jgi:hypothetical protein